MSLEVFTPKIGWRGFSTAFQTEYETAATVDTSLNFEGKPSRVIPNNDWVNTDENTGEIGPTIHQIINWIMEGEHNQKVSSHQVALIAALALGQVSTSGSSPYTHEITVKIANKLLPCRTMVEHDGRALRQYTGVICPEFTLEGARNDFVKMNAPLLGTGRNSVSAISRPTKLVENYLTYGNVNFLKNGATQMNAEMQNWKFSFNNNAKPIYEQNDDSGYVTRFERGANIDVGLEATIELIDDTHLADMQAGSDTEILITLDGGASNRIEIELPKCRYKRVEPDVDDDTLIAKCEWQVLQDTSNGWVNIRVHNTQTAYA